jgi:hypothetical protein
MAAAPQYQPAPPNGSYYVQGQNGGPVLMSGSGAPYMVGGQPLYQTPGGQFTFSNPTPSIPQAPPVYLPGGGGGTLSPYANPQPTISAPHPTTGPTSATGYVPPELAALKQIGQISPQYLRMARSLQHTYASQLALAKSGQLPPGVQREVQQQVAAQQAGTGNAAGVAQSVQQGMTTGAAGLNYLQGVLGQSQQYLGSSVTPYALGTSYVNNAINQNAAAVSGSGTPPASYNPYSGVPPNAFSYINPAGGSQFAQGTTGFMNAGVGATPGSPNTAAPLIGAGIGAAGSVLGATSSVWGPALGAGLGALAAF